MSDAKGKDASGNYDPDEPGSAPHQEHDTFPALDETTIYPAAGKEAETAQALLDAADDPRQVVWSDGAFIVPASVAKKAKVPEGEKAAPVLSAAARVEQDDAGTPPASKSAPAAKKAAPAKKAPARKAPAKKAAAPAAKPSE